MQAIVDPDISDDVILRIVLWFSRQRNRALSVCDSLSYPPYLIRQEIMPTQADHGVWNGSLASIQASILNDHQYAQNIFNSMESFLDIEAINLARYLVQVYGDTTEYKCNFELKVGKIKQDTKNLSVFTDDIDERKILSCLNLLSRSCQYYLQEITSLEGDDEDLARSLAIDLQEVAQRENEIWSMNFPFSDSNLDTTEISIENVKVRPLTDAEIVELKFSDYSILNFNSRKSQQFIRPIDMLRADCDHVLEWRMEQSPEMITGDFKIDWKQFFLALSLLGYPLQCLNYASAWTIPQWDTICKYGLPVEPVNMKPAEKILLDHNLIQSALTLAPKIPVGVFHEPKTPAEVSLRRFMQGIADVNPAEALIDFVICLESLLLPGGNKGEVSYRFRINGAWYLSGSEYNRKTTYDKLKILYDLRSSIVHGGAKSPTYEHSVAQRDVAFFLARTGLLKAIEGNWPNENTFLSFVLQESI